MTFKDIVSGNVSEDVLRASSVTPSQEKVYELERIDGGCQTDALPAVNIPPVTFLTLSPSTLSLLAETSSPNETPTPNETSQPAEEPNSSTPAEPESALNISDRTELAKLGKVVTTAAKELRQRVTLVEDRRKLRHEQEEDENEVKKARDSRIHDILETNKTAVDEAEILLDNVVSHFQSLSSRSNRSNTVSV